MDDFPKDLRNKIIAQLRRIMYLNVDYKAAIERSLVTPGKKGKNGYPSKHRCEGCKGLFLLKETHGDHVLPIVDPDTGFINWNTWMARAFLGKEQRLCVPCHKTKSKAENKIRREVKQNQKESDENEWEEIE